MMVNNAVKLTVGILMLAPILLFSCSKGGNTPAPVTAPVLSSTTVTGITKTYAVGSSSLSNTGNGTISQKGFCWSKNPAPTLVDRFSIVTTLQNNYSDTIKGLSYNTLYYVCSYAINQADTSYGPEMQFTTQNSTYSIKQLFGGGKIFYIDSTGDHGLIYYMKHSYTHYWWAKGSFVSTSIGNTQSQVGTGKLNTQKILAAGNSQSGTAAKICDDFVYDGYTDWFLPSVDELYYIGRTVGLLEISGSLFWSSTEANQYEARIRPINASTSFYTDTKNTSWGVIPVRSF